MTANIAFALGAAMLSLAIVVGAGLKGDWAVVAVYALLVVGFIARAAYGRRARTPDEPEPPAGGPEHEPERRLRSARFRRR
jgi:hypothetical protein